MRLGGHRLFQRGVSTDGVYYAGIGVVYAVSRVVAWGVAGLRMDMTPLYWFLHFLDVELLRTRLMESVFYLHIQPPLMNLFTGVVLRLFPDSYPYAFEAIFTGLGFVLYAMTFALQRRLGVAAWFAFLTSSVFAISPAFLFYEYWYFYTLPCAVLLTGSALCLAQYLRVEKGYWLAGFFVTIAVLCATRSLFHLVFYVAVAAGLAVALKHARWSVLRYAAIPFVLVLALYVKNWVLFDQFGLSSFMGRNLWITAVGNMSYDQRRALVESGELSEVSLIERWNDIRRYPKALQRAEGFEGIAALHQVEKSNGAHNFNHLAQIRVSEAYRRDAVYALTHYPKAFVSSLRYPWYGYFQVHYGMHGETGDRLEPWKRVYERFVYLRVPEAWTQGWRTARYFGAPPYLTVLVVLPASLLFGAIWTVWLWRCGTDVARREAVLTGYLVFCVVFVAIVGTTFDFAETGRYRFMTDAMCLALFGMLAEKAVFAPVRRRRSATATPVVGNGVMESAPSASPAVPASQSR